MKTCLTILINKEPVFEFDRNTELDDEKLAYLDKMDNDMKKGIRIQGESIAKPDESQRARFVVLNLIKGMQQDNHAVIFSSAAYLINRLPKLVEVLVTDGDKGIEIEFVEEPLN